MILWRTESYPGSFCWVITANDMRYEPSLKRNKTRMLKPPLPKRIKEDIMSTLQNKIDFAVVLRVTHANPNGDPLNGNRPRVDYDGYGEITDVCIKRKLRDRLLENGQSIFVQSDDRKIDGAKSLKARADAALGKKL